MIDHAGYPPIKLYTQPSCHMCDVIKIRLRMAEVPFEVIDISEDKEARDYVVNELQATSTPVVTHPLWDYPIIGFHIDETNDLISCVKAHLEYRDVVGLDTEMLHDYVWEGEE